MSEDKAVDAFRTISEVAEDLDLPQHVLRFWETRFAQIKPLKRGGGRRYYRPADVELLRGIRYLLYGEGYTIKGVQRILKEQGQRFVMQIWQDPSAGLPNATSAPGSNRLTEPAEEPADEFQSDNASESAPAPDGTGPAFASESDVDEPLPKGLLSDDAPSHARETHGRGGIISRLRGGDKHQAVARSQTRALSREEVKALQTALFDLLECKRLLDQAR